MKVVSVVVVVIVVGVAIIELNRNVEVAISAVSIVSSEIIIVNQNGPVINCFTSRVVRDVVS